VSQDLTSRRLEMESIEQSLITVLENGGLDMVTLYEEEKDNPLID